MTKHNRMYKNLNNRPAYSDAEIFAALKRVTPAEKLNSINYCATGIAFGAYTPSTDRYEMSASNNVPICIDFIKLTQSNGGDEYVACGSADNIQNIFERQCESNGTVWRLGINSCTPNNSKNSTQLMLKMANILCIPSNPSPRGSSTFLSETTIIAVVLVLSIFILGSAALASRQIMRRGNNILNNRSSGLANVELEDGNEQLPQPFLRR